MLDHDQRANASDGARGAVPPTQALPSDRSLLTKVNAFLYDLSLVPLLAKFQPRLVPRTLELYSAVDAVLAGVGLCAVALFCSVPVRRRPRSVCVSPRSRPPPPVSLNSRALELCTDHLHVRMLAAESLM